eukprot:gene25655-32133_t
MSTIWTRLSHQMQRDELDGQNSDEYEDAWSELAVQYNDYEHNTYPNACVRYRTSARGPVASAVAGMEKIYERCKDLNPSNEDRPFRDGAFLREHWKKLKSTGQQDGTATDKYDTWREFSERDRDVVVYSYAVLSHQMIENLGKLMPPHVARQTDILHTRPGAHRKRQQNESSSQPSLRSDSPPRRPRQRTNSAGNISSEYRESQEGDDPSVEEAALLSVGSTSSSAQPSSSAAGAGGGRGRTSSTSTNSSSSMETIMSNMITGDRQLSALAALSTSDDVELKQKALMKLAEIAGLD